MKRMFALPGSGPIYIVPWMPVEPPLNSICRDRGMWKRRNCFFVRRWPMNT